MILLWFAMMLFLCGLGWAAYLFIKRPPSEGLPDIGGYFSAKFSRAKQAGIDYVKAFKTLKNKPPKLQKRAIVQGEEKEIFIALKQGLPLAQVCVLPSTPLRLFVESTDCPELDYDVSFLVVGNKSLQPLVAMDYFDTTDENKRVLCASKKLLFKQANIPYLLLSRQNFIKDDAFDTKQLHEWLGTHLFSKFKTKPKASS